MQMNDLLILLLRESIFHMAECMLKGWRGLLADGAVHVPLNLSFPALVLG